MIPVILIRITFILPRTKGSHDLTFIRRMSEAVNETDFRFARQAIYILYYDISSALTHFGMSLRLGGLCYLITATTRTIGILLRMFLEEDSTTTL